MISYYFSVVTITNNNLFTIFPVNEVPRPDHTGCTVWKCLMALHSSRLSYFFFFWEKSTIFISIDSKEVC